MHMTCVVVMKNEYVHTCTKKLKGIFNYTTHSTCYAFSAWHCWLGGRKGIRPVKKTEWWDAGMVMCLGKGADLYMAQLMPLPLTISCSSILRLVLPFWCWLTQVVSDKIQEGHKTVVCVYVFYMLKFMQNFKAICLHFMASWSVILRSCDQSRN